MIRSLQAGRAFAAISVAAFHLSDMMALPRYGGIAVFADYTKLGNRGVDFFFILSGFVILFAHYGDIGKPAAWGRYLYRRFVRVYPIYWLYTLAFVASLAIFGGADARMPTSPDDWLTALSLIRFTGGEPPLQVAWTLFHEVAFYAVFSILILNRRMGSLALGAFMLLAALLYHFPAENARTALNVYSAAYNLYFLFGMCAFLLYRRGGPGLVESVLGLLMTVVAIRTNPLPHQLSHVFLALGLAILLVGITKLESSGWLRIPVLLAFVGDASYTIYLTHVSFEGLLLKVAVKLNLHRTIGYKPAFLLVLAGTVSVGCTAYYLIERPLLGMLRQRMRRSAIADATTI
jgi:peptidoglycan/LPS O-acetylase OafA/YrhL